jgi:hypothetical protein
VLANSSLAPPDAPAGVFAVRATEPDTEGPAITHIPVPDGQTPGNPVLIEATIRDASGVDSAVVYYRPLGNGGAYSAAAMTADVGNAWSAIVSGTNVAAPGVEYYIEATDMLGQSRRWKRRHRRHL